MTRSRRFCRKWSDDAAVSREYEKACVDMQSLQKGRAILNAVNVLVVMGMLVFFSLQATGLDDPVSAVYDSANLLPAHEG